MTENEISYKIRGAIFNVYNDLGPGLLESVYEAAMAYELTQAGLKVISQVALPANYKSVKLELGFRIDLLVEDTVVIEIKSVEGINDVHHKQLITYLRLSDKKLGILVNFNTADIK
jgi:GxxExxY protein